MQEVLEGIQGGSGTGCVERMEEISQREKGSRCFERWQGFLCV
jgi:hypothetical protein